MKIILYIRDWHPWVKLLLYAHLLCVAIWGPLWGSALIAILVLILLFLYQGPRGFVTQPILALVVCSLAVVIAIPGGSTNDVMSAAKLSTRLLMVMSVSGLFGLVIGFQDVRHWCYTVRAPQWFVFLITAFVRYLPIAERLFKQVIFAQRSRGLHLGIKTVFLPSSYRALMVPYILGLLRSIDSLWVSMNMRPTEVARADGHGIRVAEVVILMGSASLWWPGSQFFG